MLQLKVKEEELAKSQNKFKLFICILFNQHVLSLNNILNRTVIIQTI